MIPGALRAILGLQNASLVTLNDTDVESAAILWEQQASACFEVEIPRETAQLRLDEYVQTLNLSSSLLYGDGSLNGSTTGARANTTAQPGNLSFYALSLDKDGSPVEVSFEMRAV